MLASFLMAASCGQQDGIDSRLQQLKGKARSDVVQHLGPPTRERLVDQSRASDPCRGAEGVLEYDWPQTGFRTRVRRVLGMRPAQVLYLCVDKSDKISSSFVVTID